MFQYETRISERKWDSFLKKNHNSYFFHTPQWIRLMEQTYGYRNASRLYYYNGNEVLIPMTETKKYGLGFFQSVPMGYGGIFLDHESPPDDISPLFAHLVEGRNLALEITLPPLSPYQPGFHPVSSGWNSAHLILLDETGDDLLYHFDRNTRRNIKKAQQAGVGIRVTSEPDDYRSFFELLRQRSIEWGYKYPIHPWSLYENFCMHGSPHVVLRLAEKDGMVSGGMITLEYGETIFVWMNLSNSEHRKYMPFHLLIHDMIETGRNNGFRIVNFGASGPLDGVHTFKERFGAREYPVHRYRVYSKLGGLMERLTSLGSKQNTDLRI